MKKLLMFLMVSIPVLVILIVKLTASVAVGDVFISVQSVVIQHDPIFAMVGDTIDLDCIVYPDIATNKIVTWSSDNEEAAIVDMDGHVTFIDVGHGYITAASQDGNKRAQCYFNVDDEVVHGVELTAPQNYVHIGESLRLTATVSPTGAKNKFVQFTSSNEDIAKVDSVGNVTGLQEGRVRISVITEDGGYTDFVDLLVSHPVTALVVDKTEIITSSKTINAKEGLSIEPANATNKNVVFKVDDPEVAMVNNDGLVTFLKQGEVNLTITTVDGGFERTIKYIYTGGYVYDLTIQQQFIELTKGEAVYINYNVLPEVYDKDLAKIEFVSDDKDIADVDKNGYLHAAKGGSTTIRIRARKNDYEPPLERTIFVNVISPAEDVDIQDVMTAQPQIQLEPKSLPLGSTNETYFYQLDENEKRASVSETGLVTFLAEQPCTVAVTIFANEDRSVSKTIQVTYTAGMAGAFDLLENEKTLEYGQKGYLQYDLHPTNANVKPRISIESSNPIVDGAPVVEIMDDGGIVAVGGGSARLKVEITLYDNSVVYEYCDVTVEREAESIEILIDEEYHDYHYVTGNRVVQFSGKVFPYDATSNEIVWSINDKYTAIIDGNELIFNHKGYVVLTATIGQITNSVEIYYTGSDPVSGQVKAIVNGQKQDIPEEIMMGDSFEVVIERVVPNNIEDPKLYLDDTNVKTANASGEVLKIENNIVTGIGGGTATLVVNISSFRLSFDIVVKRLPESISVLQANSQVTSSSVTLIATVLPNDATNQKVRYEVDNPDIATIEGNVLTFHKNGVVNIRATCEANKEISCTFSIEKVEKDIVYFSNSQQQISVNKGDVLALETDEEYSVDILQNNPIVSGEQVVIIDGKYIRTLAAGTATAEVTTSGQKFSINIEVKQLVETITLATKMDQYNDEYVTAKNSIDLDFVVYPNYAANQNVKISIVRANSGDNVAYVSGKTLHFASAGRATLQITSEDGNCSFVMQIRCTGGEAVDAKLNVDDHLIMDIGQQITISVEEWLPFDCTNTRMVLSESNALGRKVIDIKGQTITAINSGETTLIVQLSNNIVKEIEIVCLNKVTDIVVEEKVLTAQDTYTIDAVVMPKTATIKDLEFALEETDAAKLEGNTLHFFKPGMVKVTISSTDGSNIQKCVSVTSTMGYLSEIVLSSAEYRINKGQTLDLGLQKRPNDAQHSDIQYKILSQQTSDNTKNSVVEISQDGQIRGIYGGSAVIRVCSTNYYGEEIYADCKIIVFSPVSSIELEFETEMQNYQNQSTFITSKSEIAFKVIIKPQDASTKDYSYQISELGIAKIEENKIIFLQKGRVSIKFVSWDTTSGEKSRTYNFYYVGQDLIAAELDKSNIQNNTINLKAGESFEFKLQNVYPNDNKNITFSLRDTNEQRNDLNKEVASFEDGVLYALNGGKFVFTLFANNLRLETLTLVVTREATDIYVEGDLQAYVSEPYYAIKAHALESDTHQYLLGYKSESEDIASVTQEGAVSFKQFGKAKIRVYVVDKPTIFKIIEIVYTKQLQALKFNQADENLYVGEWVDLYVSPLPYDADKFEYEMSIDNHEVAELNKRGDGYRLIGNAQGEVTVTAKVIGMEISVSKTFKFYNRISDIRLELDSSGDQSGHGRYRVFGLYFIDGEKKITKTYQMNVSLYPVSSSKDLLEWSSNNGDVATVDENGLVTFNKAGKVTITVKQKVVYDGAKVASDSYTFTIVEGINVWNFEEYKIAVNELKTINKDRKDNFAAIVMQTDIASTGDVGPIQITYNLYGNGYTLDFTKEKAEGHWARFNLSGQKNLVIDNVILRATSFTKGSELKGSESTLCITGCTNILLYNTIVENAETGVYLQCSSVNVEGCIFRNCLKAGINIARNETTASYVRIKDSIFTSSFCGIWFSMEKFDNPNASKLVLEGEVRFYNWSTLDQMEQGLDLDKILNDAGVSFIADELFKQARAIAAKNTNYAYRYNGEDYYNFGVIKLNADVLTLRFRAMADLDRTLLNPNCNYSVLNFSGAVNLGVVVPVEFSILSLLNTAPFIKPGETYIGDSTLLGKIEQPNRF